MLLAVLVYAIGEPGAERNHVGFQSVVPRARRRGRRLVPHRRPLQPVRRVRDDAHRELRAAHARRAARAGPLRHDLRRHQPRRPRRCSSPRSPCSTRRPAPSTWPTSRRASASCRSGVQRAFAVLLLVVFGIKAAMFPLFFWLPDSYPTAPSPITAVFAGLLTKVGVYAIIRTQTLLLPRRQPAGDAAARDRRRRRWSSACSARSPRTTSSGSCRSRSSARSATW